MDIDRHVHAIQADLAAAAALGDEATAAAGERLAAAVSASLQLRLLDEAEGAPTPGDDLSARITLRLPEGLKVQIEAVSSSEGVSTNAWIVRALSRALEPRRDRTRSGKRLQGYAQS